MKNWLILLVLVLSTNLLTNGISAKVSTEALEYSSCVWNTWFKYPQGGRHYPRGSNMYVAVDCQRCNDIETMDLYLNNKYIPNRIPRSREWGNGTGNRDYLFRKMEKGTYRITLKIKDKCGLSHAIYAIFYID